MTRVSLSINSGFGAFYYARYDITTRISNERARDCVWRSTRRYHCRRLEPDVDRFVVVPLGRIDCAVMGCFITIMAAHFPDERPEFACGYAGYECRCSETPGIDTISHATLEKFVSMLSNSLHVIFWRTSGDTSRSKISDVDFVLLLKKIRIALLIFEIRKHEIILLNPEAR